MRRFFTEVFYTESRIETLLASIDLLAENDPLYQEMLLRCRLLEKQFDAIVQTLTAPQQDTVWDFVMLCEAMSERKLELACRYLPTHGSMICGL